jgi:hypothetical protein
MSSCENAYLKVGKGFDYDRFTAVDFGNFQITETIKTEAEFRPAFKKNVNF